jgi:hypothetical protein
MRKTYGRFAFYVPAQAQVIWSPDSRKIAAPDAGVSFIYAEQ